jgi:hypothetical protein
MQSVFLEFLQIVLAGSHQVEVAVVVDVPFFLNSVLLVWVQSQHTVDFNLDIINLQGASR